VQIAAWERDESVTSVDEAARRQVKISLHHNHLPRLEQHGVVEFDVRRTSDRSSSDCERPTRNWTDCGTTGMAPTTPTTNSSRSPDRPSFFRWAV
jgi:hypothetical protein